MRNTYLEKSNERKIYMGRYFSRKVHCYSWESSERMVTSRIRNFRRFLLSEISQPANSRRCIARRKV